MTIAEAKGTNGTKIASIANQPEPEKHSHQQFDYEFGGPVGAFLTMTMLPIIVVVLDTFASKGKIDLTIFDNFIEKDEVCSMDGTCSASSSFSRNGMEQLICPNSHAPYCSDVLPNCMLGILAWFLFQVFLQKFLPAINVRGVLLKQQFPGQAKEKLSYRINGHLCFWVTLFTVALTSIVGKVTFTGEGLNKNVEYVLGGGTDWKIPLTILYDYYVELAVSTILLSVALSIVMYLKSFMGNSQKRLAEGGDSGNIIYDFFMGRELNPRTRHFDWKVFCELRPGLLGWMVLNLAMACQQYETLGEVTGSMLLIQLFQGVYVWDALYQERAILTTMDVTTDGFGYMLIFGDLAWVPFTYSLQARYLVDYDPRLGYGALGGILLTNCVGYMIFRGANGQKDAFRRNPDQPCVSHLSYLQTKRGTKLLTSGWWGKARKINYTGDWIMGLSWCLVCGLDSIVPYFYAIYFAILLIHRSVRDDHMCQTKYGSDWEEYKKIVPYRFIPGVV